MCTLFSGGFTIEVKSVEDMLTYVNIIYWIPGYVNLLIIQWPFQEPKLEVPTIYKAYFSGLCKGISPQNMVVHGTVPPF